MYKKIIKIWSYDPEYWILVWFCDHFNIQGIKKKYYLENIKVK